MTILDPERVAREWSRHYKLPMQDARIGILASEFDWDQMGPILADYLQSTRVRRATPEVIAAGIDFARVVITEPNNGDLWLMCAEIIADQKLLPRTPEHLRLIVQADVHGNAYHDHDLWNNLHSIAGNPLLTPDVRAAAVRKMDELTGVPESAGLTDDELVIIYMIEQLKFED